MSCHNLIRYTGFGTTIGHQNTFSKPFVAEHCRFDPPLVELILGFRFFQHARNDSEGEIEGPSWPGTL